jgi:hypothetical protein
MLEQVFADFTLEYYHIKTANYFKDTIIAEVVNTWSGFDPLEFEFSQNNEFISQYNSVKIDEFSRSIAV